MKYCVDTNEIRAQVVRCGYTARDIADLMGISRATVSSVLNGKRKPGYEFMAKFFEVTKMTPEEGATKFFAPKLT